LAPGGGRSMGPPLAMRHGLRGAVGPDEQVEEARQAAALLWGPGCGVVRPAAEMGVVPQVGFASDRPGALEERPTGRGIGLGLRARLGSRGRCLPGRAGPGCLERRLPAALALLLVGHG